MNPVKNLLKQLIDRLTDELNAETSHKDWCDNEKKNSADEKLKREQLISALNAEIPQLKTTIASLTSDIEYAALACRLPANSLALHVIHGNSLTCSRKL